MHNKHHVYHVLGRCGQAQAMRVPPCDYNDPHLKLTFVTNYLLHHIKISNSKQKT